MLGCYVFWKKLNFFHMCDRLKFWPSISLVHKFMYITFVFTLGFTFYVSLIGFGTLISNNVVFCVPCHYTVDRENMLYY